MSRTNKDSIDHTPACWIAPEHAERVRAAGVEVLEDHQKYIVRQLELVLRKNLADFLGVDEVEALLKIWREKFDRAEMVDRLRGDDAQLVRFTRLLRRLARERVPIVDGTAILDTVAECGLADPDATLRAVRRRLGDQPAQAVPPAQRLPLPTNVEERCLTALHESDGKTFLALPPDELRDILGAIRELVAGVRPPPALVVGSARLRPHLYDLVVSEFPDAVVFADEELAPVETAKMAAS